MWKLAPRSPAAAAAVRSGGRRRFLRWRQPRDVVGGSGGTWSAAAACDFARVHDCILFFFSSSTLYVVPVPSLKPVVHQVTKNDRAALRTFFLFVKKILQLRGCKHLPQLSQFDKNFVM
jgi:hypothetical protein